ncbi:ASH1-related protein 2 [Actinidia rufa]|uniref:ASH1-related protein 2 n=1 Tax=Actinidia rufa TaxID=165716 RepID=A0A7J0FMC8_9ERIC|nr:ASH1-related protein 2 [Actinidia rufa]
MLVAVAVADIEGRGRALVASQPLTAREILLRDSPILLYSALPLNPPPPLLLLLQLLQNLTAFTPPPPPPAPPAPSPSYAAPPAAPPPSPPPTPPGSANPSAASGTEESPDAARLLHSLVSSLSPPASEFGFSPELTAALLAKDKLNAFGLMEPFSEDGEGSVRAYGIYPNASFFNHDCLPNACRFNYVDASDAGGFNTNIIVRVIHDVPQRREICLGYFPVNLNYSERQRRLKEDYGFACACDRCKVETNWVEEEEEEEAMDDEVMEVEDVGVGEEYNDCPHAYLFLRYMCERKNCWGKLAPLPPSNGAP